LNDGLFKIIKTGEKKKLIMSPYMNEMKKEILKKKTEKITNA
jgi:hypothetical protein